MPENTSCFDAILRRLLCSGEVPTHPSPPHSNQTQLNSPTHKNKPNSHQTNADVITPGIIARLMGLDSLPECNRLRNPDGVTRSKSVSFADYLMEDSNVAPASLHRRVRTSVSFREGPEVKRLHEGQEFLVVYLDSVDKNEKEKVGVRVMKKTEDAKRGRKKSENNEAIKKTKNEEKGVKRKSEKVLKAKDESRRECKTQSLRVGRQDSKADCSIRHCKKVVSKNGSVNLREEKKKKVVTRPKLKKGNHHNAVKSSSCSENSSPVSVFEIDEILIQHETWLSEYSSSKELKSQMKSPPRTSYNEDSEMRAVKFRDMETVKKDGSEDDTAVLASKILKMTEEELKESNWVSRNEVEYERLEEICVEVEGLILDVLLNQMINDLVQLS